MNVHVPHVDPIERIRARLAEIEQERAGLDAEQAELETAIAVFERLMEPQPMAAQTVAAHEPVVASPAESEAVAISAPIPDVPEEPAVADAATPSLAASASSSRGDEPPRVEARVTVKSRVLELHNRHPEWTMRRAAEHLGITHGSISGHSSALGIKWAAEPKAKEPAPPKSKLFYLRNDYGEYLHQHMNGFTRLPQFYWSGTEADILALKKRLPKFADLTERAVL